MKDSPLKKKEFQFRQNKISAPIPILSIDTINRYRISGPLAGPGPMDMEAGPKAGPTSEADPSPYYGYYGGYHGYYPYNYRYGYHNGYLYG